MVDDGGGGGATGGVAVGTRVVGLSSWLGAAEGRCDSEWGGAGWTVGAAVASDAVQDTEEDDPTNDDASAVLLLLLPLLFTLPSRRCNDLDSTTHGALLLVVTPVAHCQTKTEATTIRRLLDFLAPRIVMLATQRFRFHTSSLVSLLIVFVGRYCTKVLSHTHTLSTLYTVPCFRRSKVSSRFLGPTPRPIFIH